MTLSKWVSDIEERLDDTGVDAVHGKLPLRSNM